VLHIAKKRELTEFFRSIPLEKKQQVYRGVRAVIAMLVKISKMTELYAIRDKIFTEFTETLMQNLDVIHNNIPYVSVTTKKIGFYYQERRINLFDAGERKFRNIFLVNEIRELYFVKGITPEELLNFFSVIQETINYTLIDYDFNTRLWDRGVTHIGTLSDPDMGDPEPWGAEEFKGEFDPVAPAALYALPPRSFHDLAAIVKEFESVGATGRGEFDAWRRERGKAFTIQRYLEKARLLILRDGVEANRSIIGKMCEYALTNLQEGDFISGMVYLTNLQQLRQSMEGADEALLGSVASVFEKIRSEQFINKVFEVAATIGPEHLPAFGEYLKLVSAEELEPVFLKLVELGQKEARLHGLEAIAGNLTDEELVKRLATNPDWHVVRNLLYMLRFSYRPSFLPTVREAMHHPTKQVRIEAAHVLSRYDADENVEFWHKAVLSPDEEVRVLAVENLLRIKGLVAKQILNEMFKPAQLARFSTLDLEQYVCRILASKREEFFDLPGNLIFNDNAQVRIMALKCLNTIGDPSAISSQVIRRIKSPEFETIEQNEMELLLALLKGTQLPSMLDALTPLWTMQGGLLNRKRYAPLKKRVFGFLRRRAAKSGTITKWLEKAKKDGDAETKEILAGR